MLLIFVIPVFENMFATVNLALPLPTRIVIVLSKFLKRLLVGGRRSVAWFTVVSLKRYYATPNGKLAIDRLLLKVPVLGDVLRKSAVSRFTRTLGTLIASGVSILDGLEITAKTAGNRVIQDAIMESRASIAGGDTIAAPLQKSNVFPPMVISMIAVGEQTGGLDEMLTKIADFYDDEVDAAVSRPARADGAGDDRVPRRGRRRHGRRDVPADLRHDQRGAVGHVHSRDAAVDIRAAPGSVSGFRGGFASGGRPIPLPMHRRVDGARPIVNDQHQPIPGIHGDPLAELLARRADRIADELQLVAGLHEKVGDQERRRFMSGGDAQAKALPASERKNVDVNELSILDADVALGLVRIVRA